MTETAAGKHARQIGLVVGITAFALGFLLPHPEGLPPEAHATAAAAVLIAIWWMSEAAPLAVTALLPLVLFPLLSISSFEETATAYANPLIFLFLGGFILAKGLERWKLHRRLAYAVLSRTGERPAALIAGVMGITAFLSMWISNTATTMVMLPIALSIAGSLKGRGTTQDRMVDTMFAPALMLSVAYSATIGGMGTLIGTPPNALFAAFLQQTYGLDVSFASWMMIGLPSVALLLPLTFFILTRISFRIPSQLDQDGSGVSKPVLERLPPMNRQEKTVALVMIAVALSWLLRPLILHFFPGLPLTDAGIAMTGAILLFILPDDFSRGTQILGWDDLKTLRWDVLILFGGGLALAQAIGSTGLADWVGSSVTALGDLPPYLLVLTVMVVIVYLGELASNTAMAAVFLPVAGAAAVGIGESPLALAMPVVLAASLGFMLPVATPPNAIVFGSGAVSSAQMLRAGAVLDVVAILGAFIVAMTFGRWVFGL